MKILSKWNFFSQGFWIAAFKMLTIRPTNLTLIQNKLNKHDRNQKYFYEIENKEVKT